MRSTPPLLSVGLPVYNGLPYLEETLRSVGNGSFGDYELIVCDNASTDATGDLVRSYAAQDPRIRYVRNEQNIGAARNYNKCLALAEGKYFRWVASDDLHSPNAVARCVELLESDPSLILAFPETRLIDGAGAVIQDYDDGDGWSSTSPAERFWNSLTHMGLSNSMFGVIRTHVLHGATLQGDFPASDLVMQADLAIRGPFGRVKGEYYFRRMHDGCTDALDPVALAQFYDPSSSRAVESRLLRLFRELAGVVWRAPVPMSDKASMWVSLARRANWDRPMLTSELRHSIHNAFGGSTTVPTARHA